MKIGLTGGIGCGKSTAAKFFAENGFRTESADAIVHDLLQNDGETIEAVVALLGQEVEASNGGVDRSRVAKLVFGDKDRLKSLEAILHPRVREVWERAAAEGEDCVIEIPLLFEKNLQKNVDQSICVFSDPVLQVERLEQRGLSRADSLARMKRQMPLSEKAQLADYVLLNDGSLKFLEMQVRRLTSKLKSLQD